jgi:hypothetical protein
MRLCTASEAKHVWIVRESSLGVISHVPGEPLSWEGWEDSAVAPQKLGNYLRDLKRLMSQFGYHGTLYGHFGHGCVHTRTNFDHESEKGIASFRQFMNEAADLVVSYGGSLSGEHGEGQARAERLPKMFGPELIQAFNEFKNAWDPDWKMNPGMVVEPYRLDENLRLGADYNPWRPHTHFKFPQDHGSLAHATLRCVGVGKCRHYEGGVMCPSFRVTREEEHSTRGRAHLLWEMANGDIIQDGWRSEEVKKSLDLCLACKGCKRMPGVGRRPTSRNSSRITQAVCGPSIITLREHHFGAAGVECPRTGQPGDTVAGSDIAKVVTGIRDSGRFRVRAPHLQKLGRSAPAASTPPTDRRALARHFQQLLPSEHCEGRGRRSGECGLSRGIAAGELVLRAPALRLRHAGAGRRSATERARLAGPGDRGRCANRWSRAELHRGVPRRALQPVSP